MKKDKGKINFPKLLQARAGAIKFRNAAIWHICLEANSLHQDAAAIDRRDNHLVLFSIGATMATGRPCCGFIIHLVRDESQNCKTFQVQVAARPWTEPCFFCAGMPAGKL
jgi:hypothetical protein